MEFSHRKSREAKQDSADKTLSAILGHQAVGNRVRMSVRRPDGTLFEYFLPIQPLGVYFTTKGPIEQSITDENN